MKIVTVVGARPQFIKAAALSRALRLHRETNPAKPIENVLVHTGQHYDANMSDVFFQQLGISAPNWHFEVGGSSHGAMTGKMLEQIESMLMQEKPDWVLVYGDTNSTLAGALAAAKLNIPVAHVEAGLRSFNRAMPEEINRILSDHCANLLFTTHDTATAQLVKEGIPRDKIHEVGDVMCDVARAFSHEEAHGKEILMTLGTTAKQYILATVHRPVNTDDPARLKEILQGLNRLAEELTVIFPVHPRTRHAMQKLDGVLMHSQLRLIDPTGYLEMLALERGAQAIITDSGGVQKEAYFCHVPCLILREETEWVELVEQGYGLLVESRADAIVEAYHRLAQRTFNWHTDLYGAGDASNKILNILLQSTDELTR